MIIQDKNLTWELLAIRAIEQAIETAALMLGSDKSRGYCMEMICADLLAGANLDDQPTRGEMISRSTAVWF